MVDQEDFELIKKVGQGDSKSFESLVRKYHKLIFGYCRKIVGDINMAEDMAQETWMKIVKNAEQYRPLVSVQAWMLKIARNQCIDQLREKKRWAEMDEQEFMNVADMAVGADEFLSTTESYEMMQKAIGDLSEKHRAILLMSIAEELTMTEIARELNMSVSAVKVTFFRIREQLKAVLGEQ